MKLCKNHEGEARANATSIYDLKFHGILLLYRISSVHRILSRFDVHIITKDIMNGIASDFKFES